VAVGEGLLGEADEGCTALINGMEGLLQISPQQKTLHHFAMLPVPPPNSDFYYKALGARHTVNKRKSDLRGEIHRLQ
jgi:hypothetical protein